MSGAPAGVAGEEAHAPDREVLGLRLRRHEAELLHDRRGRVLHVVELREHHERIRLHRTADEHRVGRPRKTFERGHRVDGRDLRRPAEHEPHRALVVVVRDQDDGLAEVRIVQGRR